MTKRVLPRISPRGCVVACIGIAIAGAACGSTAGARAGTNGDKNAVLTAYEHTLTTKSARVTISETIGSASSGSSQQISVTGSGETDLTAPDGTFTFSVPTGGTIRMRILANELYIELPAALRSQIPGNKPWLSLDVNKLVQAKLGASLSQLSSSSQAPTQTLSYLQAVSSDGLVNSGSVKIGGVETTAYKASVDLDKVAASKSGAAQTAIKTLEGELHSSSLPVEVWIDAQNRVRQLTYSASVSTSTSTTPTGASGTTGSSTVTVTMGLSDFGLPVSVAVPPADQVYDATNQALAASSTTS
jgi:hypothetical protein